MRYERLPLLWLLVYVVACSILPGIFFSAATHWSVELGLAAGAFGAVFGALGWLMMGIRIQSPYSYLLEAYEKRFEQLETSLTFGLQWRNRAASAEALLTRATPYLHAAPLEGVMTVADDIQQHFITVEEAQEEGNNRVWKE